MNKSLFTYIYFICGKEPKSFSFFLSFTPLKSFYFAISSSRCQFSPQYFLRRTGKAHYCTSTELIQNAGFYPTQHLVRLPGQQKTNTPQQGMQKAKLFLAGPNLTLLQLPGKPHLLCYRKQKELSLPFHHICY